jgi:glycosyltransferase involved in cell wall biosynthesis
MKIAIWYNLPSGGAKRSLHMQVRGLLARGHEVRLYRPPVPQASFLNLAELAPEVVVPQYEFERDSRFYFGKLWLYSRRVDRMVEVMSAHARQVALRIEKENFDVLYSNICMQFHAPFLGRYVDLPKSIYLHEPKRFLHEAMPELPWLLPDPYRLWSLKGIKTWGRVSANLRTNRRFLTEELKNVRTFDQILVNSRFSRESVWRAYNLNSEVCYLGVDTEEFRDLNLPRERFILGLGTLGPTKNVRLAIEAIATIPASIRPKLVWVANMADEVYHPEMVKLATELGVEFEPRLMVSEEELLGTLNRAWAMVYAPRLEPFGLAPLEANACGTPVVAVAEGGVRETIVDGENGFVVDHDAGEIGGALQRLLEDATLRDRMGKQARELICRNWTVEAHLDRLEAKLSRLANK